jgi:signal transduction histidine kinase
LLLFTRGGRAILASGRVEEFFGKTAAEILGRPASEVFGPGEVADTVRVALEAGRDFPPQEAELRGRRITLEVHFISSLTNPGDRRRQDPVALVRLRDVESVRNLESQLQVSNRLAAISRLTSGVAHEVKNPLNAMVLHLEALKSKLARAPGAAGVSELRDSLQEHIEIIAREAYRLDRVVKTFLDFARPVELNLRETDLNELVREVVSLAETEAVSRNIRVVFDPNGATPRVRVDRDLIKQALLNVVLNGCQAMPHGGTLTITGETQGGEIELAVADEGPGIAAEIRDKVFNLYFTTREKGSGIGLPLAFRAFQLHNGTIAFDNRAEGGAVFRMRLPLAEETVRL